MRPTVKQKPPQQPKVAPRISPRATAPLTPGSRPSTPGGPPSAARPAAQAPLTPGPRGQLAARAQPQAQRAVPKRPAAQDKEKDETPAQRRSDQGTPLPPGKPPPLKQQIESYFSDTGLSSDIYLRELIQTSPGGWVDVEEILNLKRIKALRASKDDVLDALSVGKTWLEVFESDDGISAAVRRPPNRPVSQQGVAAKPLARVASKDPQQSSVQARGVKSVGLPAKRPIESSRLARPAVTSAASGRMLFPGRLSGSISSYDEESGDAAIACAQTEALFQKDVVLTWQELEKAGTAIDIGSLVSFLVELGPNGEPQARDLQLRTPEDEEEGLSEDMQDEELMPSKKRKIAEAEEASVGSRYTGIFKSFNKLVRLGLIACKETHATFGRDVAVDADECAGFVPRDSVSFELALDEMGTPKAVGLEAPPENEDDAEILQPTAKSSQRAPQPPTRLPPRLPKASSRPLTPPRSAPGATPSRSAAPAKLPLKALASGKAIGPGKAPSPGKGASAGIVGARLATPAFAGKASLLTNGKSENGNEAAKGGVKLTAKAKPGGKGGLGGQSSVAKPPAGPPPQGLMQRSPSTPPVAISGRWQGIVKSVNPMLGSGRISFSGKRPMPTCSEVVVTDAELTGFVVGDAVSFGLTKERRTGALQAVDLEAEDME